MSNHDGSPAPDINVEIKSGNEDKGEARTGKNGIATFSINTRDRATSLLITVTHLTVTLDYAVLVIVL